MKSVAETARVKIVDVKLHLELRIGLPFQERAR